MGEEKKKKGSKTMARAIDLGSKESKETKPEQVCLLFEGVEKGGVFMERAAARGGREGAGGLYFSLLKKRRSGNSPLREKKRATANGLFEKGNRAGILSKNKREIEILRRVC